ncbi:CCR4-NOT transcription complex subunit 1-like isoform X2 [Gordionus sp. m RMFG-2023]|uniref:CCR4-NOT transcription complex subunit 1-like isoform X2 n=1 Tax=Gordionus sp. m RMFG-2023 TaxID=3053472 RepID=UPI0031FC84AF
MNLDPLSFALAEIDYALKTLSKSSYKANAAEISQLVGNFGFEGERHLIKSIYSEIDFSDYRTINKEYPQIQYLKQEYNNIINKSNFISLICNAIENIVKIQKHLKVPQILSQLSKLSKLSRVEEIAYAICLIHSSNNEIKDYAKLFIKQKLPEFLKAYLDGNFAIFNQNEISQEITFEILYLFVVTLIHGKDDLGIFQDKLQAFIHKLRRDFPPDQVPVILAPHLYPYNRRLRTPFNEELHDTDPMLVRKLVREIPAITKTMVDVSKLVTELGYDFCSSLETCQSDLIEIGVHEITPASVARILGGMASSHAGLIDGISLYYDGRNTSSSDNSTRSEPKDANKPQECTSWNTEIFVKAMKEVVPHFHWRDVVYELDQPGLILKEKQGFKLIMEAITLGLEFNMETFPVDFFYRSWNNSEEQLSWLELIVQNPDVLCFSDFPSRQISTEILKLNPEEECDRKTHIWKSLDMIEALLKLSERGHYQRVQELFRFPLQNCPEILMLALLQIKGLLTLLGQDLLASLIPHFLSNNSNSLIVLQIAWHNQYHSNITRTLIMHSMADWYVKDPNDQSRLSRILDIAQDLKALSLLLNCTPFGFIIDLACLASRREYLKLEKWLAEKIREHSEPFIWALIYFLKRRCPNIFASSSTSRISAIVANTTSQNGGNNNNGNKDISLPKALQLPTEIVNIMLNTLQNFLSSHTSNNNNILGMNKSHLFPSSQSGGSLLSPSSFYQNKLLSASSSNQQVSEELIEFLQALCHHSNASIANTNLSLPGSITNSGNKKSPPQSLAPLQPNIAGNRSAPFDQSPQQQKALNVMMNNILSMPTLPQLQNNPNSNANTINNPANTSSSNNANSNNPGGINNAANLIMDQLLSNITASFQTEENANDSSVMQSRNNQMDLDQGGRNSNAMTTSPFDAILARAMSAPADNDMSEVDAYAKRLQHQMVSNDNPGVDNANTTSNQPNLFTVDLSAMFPDLNMASFGKDIEDEANAYFQRIYNRPPHPIMCLEDFLDMLKRFRDSTEKREREVFACMIRNLFEEYRFFSTYPDKELHVTSCLFGGLVEKGVVCNNLGLGIALRFVLEALKRPGRGDKMRYFGLTALDSFKDRLWQYPQYCAHVAALPHFATEFPSYLKEYIEYGIKGQEMPQSGRISAPNPSKSFTPPLQNVQTTITAGNSNFTSVNTLNTITAFNSSNTANRSAVSNTLTPISLFSAARSSKSSNTLMATNSNALFNADQDNAPSEVKEEVHVPSENVQDKLAFIFNNLSQANINQKTEEISELLTDENLAWIAKYVVNKRASIENNFHTLYSNFLDCIKIVRLSSLVIQETFKNIKILLRSDKSAGNFSDRSLLKNLGHWLGLLTIAKNKPLLQSEIDLKQLILDAGVKGIQDLLFVIPFAAKILESCAKSKVFKPPNPWTMAIMHLLAEIHKEPDMKLNLKFEIEMLCKAFSLDINALARHCRNELAKYRDKLANESTQLQTITSQASSQQSSQTQLQNQLYQQLQQLQFQQQQGNLFQQQPNKIIGLKNISSFSSTFSTLSSSLVSTCTISITCTATLSLSTASGTSSSVMSISSSGNNIPMSSMPPHLMTPANFFSMMLMQQQQNQSQGSTLDSLAPSLSSSTLTSLALSRPSTAGKILSQQSVSNQQQQQFLAALLGVKSGHPMPPPPMQPPGPHFQHQLQQMIAAYAQQQQHGPQSQGSNSFNHPGQGQNSNNLPLSNNAFSSNQQTKKYPQGFTLATSTPSLASSLLSSLPITTLAPLLSLPSSSAGFGSSNAHQIANSSSSASSSGPVLPIPHFQFKYGDIDVSSIASGLLSRVQINSQIPLFQLMPQLRQVVRVALERSVQEILPPLTERVLKITLATAESLIKKDFALDPDEARVRTASHHLIRFLAGGISLYTVREPLYASLLTNFKSALALAIRGTSGGMTSSSLSMAPSTTPSSAQNQLLNPLSNAFDLSTLTKNEENLEDLTTISPPAHSSDISNLNLTGERSPPNSLLLSSELLEHAASCLASDNFELACCFAQKTTIERAVSEIDRRSVIRNRSGIKRHVGDTGLVGFDQLPAKIRPKMGGASPNQSLVYDVFSRNIPGFLSNSSLSNATSSFNNGPPQKSSQASAMPGFLDTRPNEPENAYLLRAHPAPSGILVKLSDELDKRLSHMGIQSDAISEYTSPNRLYTSAPLRSVIQLSLVIRNLASGLTGMKDFSNINEPGSKLSNSAMAGIQNLIHKCIDGLVQCCNSSARLQGKHDESLAKLRDAHVLVLKTLQDPRTFGPQWVNKHVTKYLVENKDDIGFDLELITVLYNDRLLNASMYDSFLSQCLENTMDHGIYNANNSSSGAKAISYVIKLVNKFCVNERENYPLTDSDLYKTIDALANLSHGTRHNIPLFYELRETLNHLTDHSDIIFLDSITTTGSSPSRSAKDFANLGSDKDLSITVYAAMFHSGVSAAKEFDDPIGLRDRVDFLYKEWLETYRFYLGAGPLYPGSLSNSTNAANSEFKASMGEKGSGCGRRVDIDSTITNFMMQMHQQGIFKTDDLITRFFRICTDICLESCYKSLQEPDPRKNSNNDIASGKATENANLLEERARLDVLGLNNCYQHIDAYVKLISLLIKHSNQSLNNGTQVNLMNKVLGIFVGLLVQHHRFPPSHNGRFQPVPFYRLFSVLYTEIVSMQALMESHGINIITAFCNAYHVLRPSEVPGFAFSWLELIAHRTFIAKTLTYPSQSKIWNYYALLLTDMFKFLAPFLRNVDLPRSLLYFYNGSLRLLLVLLHDFPEFLCDFHYGFCDAIPPHCVQMRNLILSAFPRDMRLPDPFTPNLKVDMLPEIGNSPKLTPHLDFGRMVNDHSLENQGAFKKCLDIYLKTRSPVTFLTDIRSNLQAAPSAGSHYNIPLLNALVLYVGTQAISSIQNKGLTPGLTTITHSAHMDIFQNLAVGLDSEGRYLFLNAIANQLRYPNSHTHYFSCILLHLFAEANTEAIQEQITRVLLERLIVNRPHPWGLLITFIELIKNSSFNFWQHDFVRCAPEIEKLFDSVSKSCMQSKPTPPLSAQHLTLSNQLKNEPNKTNSQTS